MKQPNTFSLPAANIDIYLRSALVFLGYILTTLAIAPIVLLSKSRPFEVRYGYAKLWVSINLWTMEKICGVRYEVQGLENITAHNGVILAKHQSTWETFAFLKILPPVVFLLKQELLQIPVWGRGLATLEPIAIDRDAKTAALKQVMRDGAARLKAGRWVVIFPEGTRVAPGERVPYNASGAILAHKAGCPVIPVAHNAGEYWPRKSFLKFPGVIQVRIGPPIDGSKHSAAEINQQAEEWIEAQMLEISRARAGQG
jgi:1-acyl-sn-glycerol-3-phosphate acyltransferase